MSGGSVVSMLTRAGGVLALVALAGCFPDRRETVQYQEQVFQECVPCHLEKGQGDPTVGAPNIAGLPDWYVRAQLRNFNEAVRGTHPADIHGARMRPMAIGLTSNEKLGLVAEYVSSMAKQPAVVSVEGGNATAGEAIFLSKSPTGQLVGCASCHGVDASGSIEKRAPSLTIPNDWYLVRQLHNFKAGVRGAHADDKWGANMAAQTGMLKDEQAIKDVVAYIQTLRTKASE